MEPYILKEQMGHKHYSTERRMMLTLRVSSLEILESMLLQANSSLSFLLHLRVSSGPQ
jgi:hypothetical protein